MRIRRPFRKWRRAPLPVDEEGGRFDGGLVVRPPDSEDTLFTVSARVTSAMRFFIARVGAVQGTPVPHRLAITSAQRGEGVTYVTRALGAVLAYDTPQSVAIVDCNWTVPNVEAPETQALGLADVVAERATLDDVMIRTANDRFVIVPPGAVALARRSGMATGEPFERTLAAIAERFDHVLLDLPPVLASSEAISLSARADAFVLVVRQGSTPSARVEAALEEMRRQEALGVVLNRYSTKIPMWLRRLVET